MPDHERATSILGIFAVRATEEFERLRFERALRKSDPTLPKIDEGTAVATGAERHLYQDDVHGHHRAAVDGAGEGPPGGADCLSPIQEEISGAGVVSELKPTTLEVPMKKLGTTKPACSKHHDSP
ncbi:MAG: hypothetical protein P0120_11720 [Nitrospira sp.]|nr:hypothetical protein [Nitrospira sp.]